MLPGILCDANNYRILIQKDVPRISTMCDGGRAGEPKNWWYKDNRRGWIPLSEQNVALVKCKNMAIT